MATKYPEWAEDDIADIGNGDPNKDEPLQAKKSTGWVAEIPLLQEMNWIQNNFAYWIRSNNQVVEPADLAVLTVGSKNVITGGETYDLPPDPLDGQLITVWHDPGTAAEGNPATIRPNGNQIKGCGLTEPLLLNIDNAVFQFYFDGAVNVWQVNLIGTVAEGSA